MTVQLLKELCEAAAIPGREKILIDIMNREFKKSSDKVSIDGMGNVIGYKKGDGKARKKVMIAGHMDEIGFIVTNIDKNGHLRFLPRGGHIPKVLISQRVKIMSKKPVTGIVEGPPTFISDEKDARRKTSDFKDLFIDTGLSASVVKKTIEVGDFIVLDRGFIQQGDVYISKAFDNRVGCYIVLETMRRLKKHQVDVYGVGTTQEEVGIRGATNASRDIAPDIGIALDVTAAFDTPGVEEHKQVTKLGAGAAIKINDSYSISNHGIVKHLKTLAKKHKIPFQMEVLPFGGTDARGMQMFGSGPVCTISIPTRYVHSPNEMINKKDLEAAIQLLVKFIESSEKCKLEF